MRRERLDEAVRRHYEAAAPRPETLERLRELAELPPRRSRTGRRLAFGVAAATALLLIVLLAREAWVPAGAPLAGPALALSVAAEVALNHTKALRPDVKTR